MEKKLVEEVIQINVKRSNEGFEWGLIEREEAAKGHKHNIEKIRNWCKKIINKNNQKSLSLNIVESLRSDNLSLVISLVVEYDEKYVGVCDEVSCLQSRLNLALKMTPTVFKAIEKKNPKNHSAVRLSTTEDKDDVLKVGNNDVLTLVDELRKKPRKKKEETTLTTSEGDVAIAFHGPAPLLLNNDRTEIQVFKIVAYLDKKNIAIGELNGASCKEYNLSWSGSDEALLPSSTLRENLIMNMKDQRLIELRVCPITQQDSGIEIIKGYNIVEYIGIIQNEIDLGR